MNYQVAVIRHLDVTLIVISLIILLLRLYSRIVIIRKPGLDDALAFAALCFAMTQCGLDIKQTYHGTGVSMADLPPQEMSLFFSDVQTILFVFVTGSTLIRLSICAFLPRLDNTASFKKFVWGLVAMILIVNVTVFLIVLLQCKPVSGLWNRHDPNVKCINIQVQAITLTVHGAVGIFFDLILFGTPIWLIYHQMIRTTTSIKIMLVFSIALLSIVTNIIRLRFIVVINMGGDYTIESFNCAIWSGIELHTGFWAACLPAIQPLLRLVSFKLGLRSRLETHGDTYQHSRSINEQKRQSKLIKKYSINSSREQIVAVSEHEMHDFDKRLEVGYISKQGSELSLHGHNV